ncbi:MAG: helix-turn-helix domain-containing protein [Clostridiales bacterium]|nr:helix-turn-helix domain-containing protein [Clostridiales bacterium]
MKEQAIEKWVTLKEVQDYLGVGRDTILQWIAKRNMPAYKVGRLWKFKLSEVDDWIRSGGASDDNTSEKDERNSK